MSLPPSFSRSFAPTRPPRGRLARLGVVFHAAEQRAMIPALARMSERAGIDAVWLWQADDAEPDLGFDDAIELATNLAPGLERLAIGVLVDAGKRLSVAMAIPSGLEVGILSRAAVDMPAVLAAIGIEPRPLRLGAVAPDVSSIGALLGVVDDLILPGWCFDDLEAAADEARAEASETGRETVSLGIASLLPVSIGRTEAEAAARVRMDATFARFGHPAEIGIFGTLEECQDRVIAFAHAGVTDLRCVLPATDDVHDVLAQLTAMVVGSTDVLRPGSLRSAAPAPPDGWGGRSDRPPSPRVSGGSRPR